MILTAMVGKLWPMGQMQPSEVFHPVCQVFNVEMRLFLFLFWSLPLILMSQESWLESFGTLCQ